MYIHYGVQNLRSSDDLLEVYQDFFPLDISQVRIALGGISLLLQDQIIRSLEQRTIREVTDFCYVLGTNQLDQIVNSDGENYVRELFISLGRKVAENFLNTL